MFDFLIVGGGVVGLSIAWELSQRDKNICIVDRQAMGRSTSWAAAGILPPPLSGAKHDAMEQLRTASHLLHVEWSARLRAETGLDNELRECGGIYFARTAGEAASLRVAMHQAIEDGVTVEELSQSQLVALEPTLSDAVSKVRVAFHLPEEMQIRSPRHLQALIAACARRGVEMRSDVLATSLNLSRDCVTGIRCDDGVINAKEVVLCGGPWTAALLEPLGILLPVEPWRGQLILWKTSAPLLSRVVNEGLRYFVPRDDGHLIVGATVEDVGFHCQNTEEAVESLREYSCDLIPALRDETVRKAWAGLRPKTPDGYPFMGRVPGFSNLSVVTGHYRSGIHLSPATAVFMAQLLVDDRPQIDAAPFRLSR